MLGPGVQFLLSLAAGNAPLERFFGKAKSIVMNMMRHGTSYKSIFLHCNAVPLQMPGYEYFDPAMFEDDATEDVEGEDVD